MKIAAYSCREYEAKAFDRYEKELGFTVLRYPENLSMANVDGTLGCDGVTISGSGKLDQDLFVKLKQNGIKFVACRSVGYNHIDLEAAQEMGIRVSKGAYAPNGVADFTVMLMLMCLRHCKPMMARAMVNDYTIDGLQGKEMHNQTVGIVGAGNIGRTVAKNLSGFGCKILAYDPYPSQELEGIAQYVSLEEIFRESDILSFHVPLFEESYHLVNEETLKQMKDGVILVNTARGELLDTEALIRGIESQKIGALGLDVLEGEGGIYFQDHRCHILQNQQMAYLRQFPNVVMTHHCAFYTDQAGDDMVRNALTSLNQMERGEPCPLEVTK